MFLFRKLYTEIIGNIFLSLATKLTLFYPKIKAIYSSLLINSPKQETVEMSINGRIKQIVVHVYTMDYCLAKEANILVTHAAKW